MTSKLKPFKAAKKQTKATGRKRPKFDDSYIQNIIDTSLAIDESVNNKNLKRAYPIIKLLFNPRIIDAENLPKQPVMFVGNHSTLAFDGSIFGPIMSHHFNRFIRGLGDEFLFTNPKISNLASRAGAVLGNEKVCSALMEAGKDLLVYPGGAHEANKPVEDRYTLKWKERTGFIRLAAKHGYTIVPIGMVGPDEWFDRYLEPKDFSGSTLGRMLKQFGVPEHLMHPDISPPIIKGMFGTFFPKPKLVYLGFGKPLDLTKYKDTELTTAVQKRLRNTVASNLETTISKLLLQQAQEKGKTSLARRILSV